MRTPSYNPMVDNHCYIFCWNPLTPSSRLGLAHHQLLVLAVPAAGLCLKDDALAQREDGQVWPRLSQIPGRRGHAFWVLNVGKIERKTKCDTRSRTRRRVTVDYKKKKLKKRKRKCRLRNSLTLHSATKIPTGMHISVVVISRQPNVPFKAAGASVKEM